MGPKPLAGHPETVTTTAPPDDEIVQFQLDTELDLAGNEQGERLVVTATAFGVGPRTGTGRSTRRWHLSEADDFRVDRVVGSCFLQARIDGRWVDVLRSPGDLGGRLGETVATLHALRRTEEARRSASSNGNGQPPSAASDPPRADDSDDQPSARRWQTVRRVLALVHPFRRSALLLLTLSISAVVIDIAPPMLQRFLVDEVLIADQSETRMQDLLLLLLAIVVGLFLFRVVAGLLAMWKGWIASRVGTTLTANLRNQLVEKLNSLPMTFHDRNQVGMLMSRVAYDTEALHTLVHHMTSGFLLQVLQLLGIGLMLFYLNPKLALVTMLPMPLVVAGSWYFTRYLYPRHQHYWEAVGKQASALTDMLSGIRVVKAFVQENRENERFRSSSGRLRDSRQTVDISTATFSSVMGFVFGLGGLAVWYIGGRDVLADQMTLGSLMAFLAYLAMFYAPLTSLAESTTWFSNFLSASHRIFEVLDTAGESEPGDDSLDHAVPPARGEGRVEFDHVWFGYQENLPVVRDVSLRIEPGELIGIVGRSGSGKSTLVSLIGRLYELQQGRILVDGVDVRAYGGRQLRRRIGMVLQEPFLFRGSVAQNINYGNHDGSAEDTLRAAKYADAHDFIMRMPLAYETQLGQGGSGLSGGERQRLSIARAMMFDPPILILDEATASVDAESEKAIRDAVRRFATERTTLIIAHRLSTLKGADRILVFDQGQMIEQGSHEQLMEQGGLYASLVNIQSNLTANRRLARSLVGTREHGASDSLDAAFSSEDGDEPIDSFSPDGNEPYVEDEPSRSENELAHCELQWLEPADTLIEPGHDGGLFVCFGGDDWDDVFPVRAFPASHDQRFISLRHRDPMGRDHELGMIRELASWSPSVRHAVARLLHRRYLLRHIREIRSIRAEATTLIFVVVVEGGVIRFILEKNNEGFQPFGGGGLLLRDVQGNCYVIPELRALPTQQQRLLALYLGD